MSRRTRTISGGCSSTFAGSDGQKCRSADEKRARRQDLASANMNAQGAVGRTWAIMARCHPGGDVGRGLSCLAGCPRFCMRNLERTGGEMGAEEQITEALTPAVQTAGLKIWDVERSGATYASWSSGLAASTSTRSLRSHLRYPPSWTSARTSRRRAGTCSRCPARASSAGCATPSISPATRRGCRDQDNGSCQRRPQGARHLKEATAEEVTVLTASPSGEAAEVHIPLGSIERRTRSSTWGPPPKGTKTVPSRKRAAKVGTSVGAPDNGPMAEASGRLDER